MFIPQKYILSNELAEKGNISIANFSMLHSDIENRDIQDVTIKYGNCTFVNPDSPYIPQYIRELSTKWDYTDMSNKWLSSYVVSELSTSKDCIIKALQKYHAKEVTVAGKKFIEFDKEFSDMLHLKTINILDEQETLECYKDGDIAGYIKLKKNKYLTWYNVFD